MPDQSSAATEHAILQEITRPLEALPDDPLSVVNAEFPTALRGYDRVAVDGYVRMTRQLVAELQATRSPESAVRRALERVGEEITGILQRAHETAEQITAQSRSEAEDRLEQARGEAAQIADAAERRVRELDADTDRIWLERQRIVADAEDLAGQLLSLSKTAAERFPADAEADARVATGGPDGPGGPVSGQLYDEPEPGAPEPSFTAEDEDDEDEAYFREPEPEPRAADDIEQTVAFQPLTTGDDEADAPSEPAAPSGTAGERGGASEEPTTDVHPSGDVHRSADAQRSADVHPSADAHRSGDVAPAAEDTTAVIPPASQAASRRLGH